MFSQNFQIPCVFSDRECFCHFPCFPVQWVPWVTCDVEDVGAGQTVIVEGLQKTGSVTLTLERGHDQHLTEIQQFLVHSCQRGNLKIWGLI